MDIKYIYVKSRYQFGKQCIFEEIGPEVEEDIHPDPKLHSQFITLREVDKATSKTPQYGLHEVQTESKSSRNTGILHLVGSWPKEMDYRDDEAVKRYRRRVQKEDLWITKMVKLLPEMEHCVKQNIAVNIHDMYFCDQVPTPLITSRDLRIVNTFADQEPILRPVSGISWSGEKGHIAVAYCPRLRYEAPLPFKPDAYVWDLSIPNKPIARLKSQSPSMSIDCNPRDPSLMASGLLSGQVCSWDLRVGHEPQQVSQRLYSHSNPTNRTLWINSKTNTEFFSASMAGTVKWWDIRDLRRPTEEVVMDLEMPEAARLNMAVGVSALHFETTIGSRFLAGMDTGLIVNVNRKSPSPFEKLITRYKCQVGPVLSVDRNPTVLKYFLTVGFDSVKVWTEETKENCLLCTPKRKCRFTGACWSKSRMAVFFAIDEDGYLEVYDASETMARPALSLRLCEEPLTWVTAHPAGQLLAIGNTMGKVYLGKCEGAFASSYPNEKARFMQLMDRCSRYEKCADSRQKELRMTTISYRYLPATASQPSITGGRRRTRDKKKGGKKGKSPQRGKGKDKDKGKDKEKKARPKKTTRTLPFADDPAIVEAQKKYHEDIATTFNEHLAANHGEIEQIFKKTHPHMHRRLTEEEDEEDEKSKKKRRKRRARVLRATRRTDRSTGTKLRDDASRSDMSTLHEVESAKSIDEATDAKSDSERRRTSVPKLRVCPASVCKPRICCLDEYRKARQKKAEDRRRALQQMEDDKSSEDSDVPMRRHETTPAERAKWARKLLETTRFERSEAHKKKMLMALSAAPDVLTRHVIDAKRQISAWRARVLAGKTFERKMPMKARDERKHARKIKLLRSPVTRKADEKKEPTERIAETEQRMEAFPQSMDYPRISEARFATEPQFPTIPRHQEPPQEEEKPRRRRRK